MFSLIDLNFKFDETSYVYSVLSTQQRGQRILKAYSLIQEKLSKKKKEKVNDLERQEESDKDTDTDKENDYSEDEEEFTKLERIFNVYTLCKIVLEREIETNGYE